MHGENKMQHEGDILRARNYFFSKGESGNLYFLLRHRFEWMNDFINDGETGLEVGCGTGVSKTFIKAINFKISDFTEFDFLDYKNIDALNTGFGDQTFDFVVASNMIHHVPYPMRFFDEMQRILKPGGRLIIQEVNASWCMRFILKLMKHEGYNYQVDVFNRDEIATDPDDLWSGNDVIPNLLFDNKDYFIQKVNGFSIIKYSFSEFLLFLNSGGVIAKTKHIPLPYFFLKLVFLADKALVKISPSFFALQRQIVLLKK